ncbi:uncharacterized protein LOC121255041 [Juglans microcarpa x Juglans regia]|uniref:uncharacterized protein LOC121255041 n=1 Tax=Juglans microcarpa x Juglans regia TaxID=2249226 RepID=UPI001B7E2E48|nr:uncharacterized protein LOC121255041 [Juglans microcarpa x Juglans regia]
MNAFFDGYVHSGTMLKEFVDQFDNALRKKVEVETMADFNSNNQTIPCVSHFNIEKQFQRHALRVCQLKKINVLPYVFVLDRWRKELKRRYTLLRSSYDDQRDRADALNYERVLKRCSKLATKISSDNEKVSAFLHVLDEFETKFESSTLESAYEQTNAKANVVLNKGEKILSPNVVRGKGRPPSKREVPPVEKLATKRKKPELIV